MAFVPRWGTASIGIAGIIATTIIEFEELRSQANVGQINQIATDLDALADQLDNAGGTVRQAATSVWNNNSGQAVNAFKTFVETRLASYLPDPTTSELSDYVRRAADAHRTAAQKLDDYNRSVDAIETATVISCCAFVFWDFFGSPATPVAEALVQQLVDRNVLLVRWMSKAVLQVLEKFIETAIGSFIYTGLDLTLTDSMDKAFGVPLPSLESEWHQAWTDWVACAAFYGIWDVVDGAGKYMSNLPKGVLKSVGTYMSKDAAVQQVGKFVAGSAPFSVIDNLLNGKSFDQSFPSWEAMLRKIFIGFGQHPIGTAPAAPAGS